MLVPCLGGEEEEQVPGILTMDVPSLAKKLLYVIN